jgi:predicted AlkP superfamily pyrophosphatase or phosphodiesterase
MIAMKPMRFVSLLLVAFCTAPLAGAQPAAPSPQPDPPAAESRTHREAARAREAALPPPSAYDGHPKLAIILVIDQFREDYLDRWRADFKGRGFDLFLDHGAYFPDCYYDYANLKTAPGHAAIGTGAYTDGNGIASNDWWDLSRNQRRPVTSVEDDRYQLIGLPSGEKGEASSPRNLLASTVGDELRLATQGQAKVFGISLKDRAAILPSGAAANGAFWIDHKTGAFVTSTYYMDRLPDWAVSFDSGGSAAQAEQEAGVANVTDFYDQVGGTPAANDYELNFAEALIQGEQLGQRNVTDLLTISLSANDIVGHAHGPDSPEEHAMVDALDGQLDSFFTWLDKNIPGGLGNVWVALTADHGVAPEMTTAAQYGLNAAPIDMNKLIAALNYAINMKFSPGEKINYILPNQELPYLSLNQPEFMKAGINEQEAELAVQQALPAAFQAQVPPAALKPLPAPQPPAQPPANPIPGTQPPGGTASSPGASQTPAGQSSAPPAQAQPNQPQPAQPQTTPPSPSQPQATQPQPPQASGTQPKPTAQPQADTAPMGATKNGTAPAAPAQGEEEQAAPSPNAMAQPPTNRLPPRPVLFRSYTRQQLADGPYPPTPWGELLAHSYSSNGGWYVMIVPAAFQMGATKGTNHFSPWSYDRHVPLGLYGAPFNPGIYRGRVQPVDIASTFAALLGINQPSASVGQILTQALKPAAEVKYPKEPVAHTRRGAETHRGDGAHRPAAHPAETKPAEHPAEHPAAPQKQPPAKTAPQGTPQAAQPAGQQTPAAAGAKPQ